MDRRQTDLTIGEKHGTTQDVYASEGNRRINWKKWAGDYTVNILSAREYLAIGDELARDLTVEQEIPRFKLQYEVVKKAVLKDGKPIEEDMPSKLYEALSSVVLPLNMLNQNEAAALFRLFRRPTKD